MKFIAKNADFSENYIERAKNTLLYSNGDDLPLEWICDDEKPLVGAFINGKWLTLQTGTQANGECMAVIRRENLTPLLGKKIHVKVDYGVQNSERLVFWPSDDLKPLEEWTIENNAPIYNGTFKAIESYLTGNSEIVTKRKNDIIARALQDILLSGNDSTKIRDQVIAVLTIGV